MIVSLWYADSTFGGLIHPPSRTFISRSQQNFTFFLSHYKWTYHQSLVCSHHPGRKEEIDVGPKNRLFRLNTPLPASPSLSLTVGFRVYWAVLEQGYFRVSKILATCVTLNVTGATRISKNSISLFSLPGNQPAPQEGTFTHDHIACIKFLRQKDSWWSWALWEWWGALTVQTSFARDSDQEIKASTFTRNQSSIPPAWSELRGK